MSFATIDARGFAETLRTNNHVPVIDVRTPGEFRSVHVSSAVNLPLDQLTAEQVQTISKGNGPVYVVCQSGARGERACKKLSESGIQAINVAGGTNACVQEGMSVVRGKGVISIDRQVRITAGSLILTGAILGFFVHQAFYGLSAFIGAGLLFAGLSDTCGMAMALAKMPWNQGSKTECAN